MSATEKTAAEATSIFLPEIDVGSTAAVLVVNIGSPTGEGHFFSKYSDTVKF